MQKSHKLIAFLGACLLSLLIFQGWQMAAAQVPTEHYFPETGHRIFGDFYQAFYAIDDPVNVFGYPITEVFQDPISQNYVQYFERARFELRQEMPPALRIQLTPLGAYLYKPGPKLNTPGNASTCREFPETGFEVCSAFLEFFDSRGGVALFGYPISNFEVHDQRIVQYFQRSRFEWHPENPPGQRVVLTDLGRLYFNIRGEDPTRLRAVPPPNEVLQVILKLQTRAFVNQAVTPGSGEQVIHVIVQDQNLQPISDAAVTILLRLPNGVEKTITPSELTDKNGVLRYTFKFDSQQRGLATLLVTTSYLHLKDQTRASFRIWW